MPQQSQDLRRYAQEIVESTSQIIGFDMIITDTEGVIIGATDTPRLGTKNSLTAKVIAGGREFSQTEEEARCYENNAPGTSWPFEGPSGEIVGTMAVTGHPDEVRPFALIVKKQIEMLLREKALLHAAFQRNRAIRDFLEDLNNYTPEMGTREIIYQRGRPLGFLPGKTYCALGLTVSSGPSPCPFSNTSEEEEYQGDSTPYLTIIQKIFTSKNDLAAPAGKNRFLLLHYLKEENDLPSKFRLLRKNFRQKGFHLLGGAGRQSKDLEGISRSCKEAWESLCLGFLLSPRQHFFSIENLRPEALLAHIPPREARDYRNLFLEPLEERNDWKELRRTIIAWCHGGFNQIRGAELLGIHRNTMDYRLDKISALTGRDVRNFRHALGLYNALELDLLLSESPFPEL